jgi:hypothetical protein
MGKLNGSRYDSGRKRGVMCPDWGECTQQHSSMWDYNQEVTALSNELPKNSGINDSLTNCLQQWFGKWKRVMTSILTSLLVVFGAMALIGCCVIPCV